MTNSNDRLVLGFDASCVKCSGLADRLCSAADGRIEVMPLASPIMHRWREKVLGDDAAWAPTLVRIVDDEPSAGWTGWRIAPELTQRLGPSRTWHVLSELGGEALSNDRKLSRPISRSSFLKAGMGAVLGAGILAGGSTRAWASGSTRYSGGRAQDPTDVRQLHGRELLEHAVGEIHGTDAANVLSPRSLRGQSAASNDLSTMSRAAFVEATETTGERPRQDSKVEVRGAVVTHKGGARELSLLFYQHEQRLLVHIQHNSEPMRGVLTMVHRVHVDFSVSDGPMLKTVSRSINGSIPSPVPDGDLTTMSKDPCGGCTGIPGDLDDEHLSSTCDWQWTWQCVLSAGGCALCAGCSGWFTCIGCALTACPTAVDACCDEGDKRCIGCATST